MQNLALDLAIETEQTQVELWKKELLNHLIKFTTVLDTFSSSQTELEDFISLNLNIDLAVIDRLEEVFTSWISKQCELATKKANNVSHLSIEAKDLPEEIRAFSFPTSKELRETFPNFENKRLNRLSNTELVELAIALYDFDSLEQELNKAASQVEANGFKDSAFDLGIRFGLLNIHEKNPQSIKIKKQKGRYILEHQNSSRWNFERKNWIEEIVPAIKTFEAESETSGLKACFNAILAEEDKVILDKTVPSKTKVCEGEAVEAVFFNGKFKLYLVPEVFEAMVSFIKSYSNKPLKAIES